VLAHASAAFYVAPFMLEAAARLLGRAFFQRHVRPKAVFLPNIVEAPGPLSGRVGPPADAFVTVCRLTSRWVKRKNLRNLLRALRLARRPDLRLRVIGGGDSLEQVRAWVLRYELQEQVALLGEMPHDLVCAHLRASRGLVLPSRSETFGMVYAEALLAGAPILYSRGTGFDGMFQGVGPAVDPRSVHSIAAGLLDFADNDTVYRSRVADLQSSGALDVFGRDQVLRIYAAALRSVGFEVPEPRPVESPVASRTAGAGGVHA
jgi:glycosyltransferase involved in cell wall biosynthesis